MEREVERWEYAFLRFEIGGFSLTYSHRIREMLAAPPWTTETAFRHLADQEWELVTATAVLDEIDSESARRRRTTADTTAGAKDAQSLAERMAERLPPRFAGEYVFKRRL